MTHDVMFLLGWLLFGSVGLYVRFSLNINVIWLRLFEFKLVGY